MRVSSEIKQKTTHRGSGKRNEMPSEKLVFVLGNCEKCKKRCVFSGKCDPSPKKRAHSRRKCIFGRKNLIL